MEERWPSGATYCAVLTANITPAIPTISNAGSLNIITAGSEFTSSRRPVTLIWAQDFPTRHEALAAEFVVKKWSRAKKEALARSDWQALSHFAKPPSERSTSTPPEGVSTSLDTNGDGGQ